MENGVEVVVNGAEPYAVAGEPRALEIREAFRIDLESDAVASLGLTDVAQIAWDPLGRLIVFGNTLGEGPFVFIFDERGAFVRSFLRRGQGPGEVEYPRFLGVTPTGEIPVHDTGKGKIFFFDGDGGLRRSIPFSPEIRPAGRFGVAVLANGNYLVQYPVVDASGEFRKIAYGVFDPEFRKLNDLLTWELPGNLNELVRPVLPFPVVGHSRRGIYACSQREGTDLAIYDLDGRRIRIIRKPFAPVGIPEGYEKTLRDSLPPGVPLAKHLTLPNHFPPFLAFFADDEGRLFVATPEKDAATGQAVCHVFSPDGAFILRAPLGYFDYLKMFGEGRAGEAVIQGGRIACVREKESGFKEFIVSSLYWR